MSTPYKIAIIGLGYVDLPLAIEIGNKYDVLGFDINSKRIIELQQGKEHTKEANFKALANGNNTVIFDTKSFIDTNIVDDRL